MAKLWDALKLQFFRFTPSYVVCLCFLPCGLVFGYTLSDYVVKRQDPMNASKYGPLLLGIVWALIIAIGMVIAKYIRKRIDFWQFYILLCAAGIHLLASFFYFANGYDDVGAYIAYLAHSSTFVGGYSFLHTISSKSSRALMIAGCCSSYLLGVASAISLIGSAYADNLKASVMPLTDGIYVTFAATYLSVAAVVVAILIGLKLLEIFGTVDVTNSLDNELRIANTNGSIFDTRTEIIKRIQFFYVTKNEQWIAMLIMILIEAIHYGLFIYFLFWFVLNTSMRLTDVQHIDVMLWIIFTGSIAGNISLAFCSVKVNFVSTQCGLILMTLITMIVHTYDNTNVCLWIILFLFGCSYASLQIGVLEITHLRFTECIICLSYGLKLLSTCIVYYYFVADSNNSYFYATDKSTLMAQGIVFVLISALLAIIVAMKLPNTYRTPLLDIQYGLYGIIFMKHQIEQLNVRWLNDGTIPTINT